MYNLRSSPLGGKTYLVHDIMIVPNWIKLECPIFEPGIGTKWRKRTGHLPVDGVDGRILKMASSRPPLYDFQERNYMCFERYKKDLVLGRTWLERLKQNHGTRYSYTHVIENVTIQLHATNHIWYFCVAGLLFRTIFHWGFLSYNLQRIYCIKREINWNDGWVTIPEVLWKWPMYQ